MRDTDQLGQSEHRRPATVSVVVPTYKRIERLWACLEGVRTQRRAADDVVVVVHRADLESAQVVRELASTWHELRIAPVADPGLVAALNRGLGAAHGEIVAFVDDDAVPADDWLERIVETFATGEQIAAVGGRDVIIVDGHVFLPGLRRRFRNSGDPPVGRIQWWGRMIANHHLGAGEPRDVDVLKGVNMSFRRLAVIGHGFDDRLRGEGAQVHSELSICLPLRRRGLRIVYDPAIIVRHYPAPRPHGDERDDSHFDAMMAAAHNEALGILDHLTPVRRIAYLLWGLLIGARGCPGVASLARDAVRGRGSSWGRFVATQRGRGAAWRTHRHAPRRDHPRADGGQSAGTNATSSPSTGLAGTIR